MKRRWIQAACMSACLLLIWASPVRSEDQGPGSLDLASALEMARENNEDLAILAEHVKQSKALSIQVLSGMLPWITATASVGFTEEVVFGSGDEARVVIPGTDWGWGGSVTLTLVDPSVYPALVSSTKNVKASKSIFEQGVEDTLYYTAQAYVTAVFAEAAVKVRQRELETRQQNLDEVRARLEADEALLLDVSRAELQVLESQQALEAARVDAVLAMDSLCLLMGQEPGTPYSLAPMDGSVLDVPTAPPTEAELSAQLEKAQEQRDDLDALDLTVQAYKAQKLSSWFGLLPTLSFSATYDQGPESFRSPDGINWMVTFNMTWVLLDGGYTAGKIKQSSSQMLEAELSYKKTQKEVDSQVRTAWLLFDLAITNRDTAIKKLQVAEKSWEMAHEKYQAGLLSSLEVEASMDDLAEAEMQLLGHEMNLQLAWMEYLRASGQFTEVFGLT